MASYCRKRHALPDVAVVANPGKTLNNAKSLGYLDSSSPGEFTINSVGENLIAMTLPGGGEVKAKVSKPANKPRKKPAKGR